MVAINNSTSTADPLATPFKFVKLEKEPNDAFVALPDIDELVNIIVRLGSSLKSQVFAEPAEPETKLKVT